MLDWASFADATDDDVLLLALGLLRAGEVLSFAAASASVAARLVCASDGRGGAALRFAAAHLGREVTHAAAAAAAGRGGDTTTSDEDVAARRRRRSGGPLAALRALASSAPAAEALRQALMLARRGKAQEAAGGATHAQLGTAAAVAEPDARAFLDVLFRSEVRRKARGPGAAALAAADAALTALLAGAAGGDCVLLACAQVVRDAERELDALVEEERVEGFHAAYETVARRRSAAEFLRQRLDAAGGSCAGGPLAAAKRALDVAVGELDETIAGYTKEGYDLACPRLASAGGVPYAHWWVFLGRPHCNGWAVLR